MEPTKEQLERLKICERDMLACFVNICEKIGVKYFVLGGTLLGAVRHSGFIPWDDDVDVCMLREDYEQFIAQAAAYLPDYYFLQTHQTDPQYPNNFAKLRDSRTTYIETSAKNLRINHGVYIDIFPMDYYPEGFAAKIYEIKKRLLSRRINSVYYLPDMGVKARLSGIVARSLYPDLEKAIAKREKLFSSYRNTSRLVNNSGAWSEKEIIPVQWFEGETELTFEGIKVKAPAKYDQWLSFVYGDYMSLPPEAERTGHHYADIIDLDKPYSEYI